MSHACCMLHIAVLFVCRNWCLLSTLLSDQVQEASGQNGAGVRGPVCRLLAAQSRHLPVPLLPLWPGGHLAGPLHRQRVCSHSGLRQLLCEPFRPLPDEQKLQQTLQEAAPVLLFSRTTGQSEQREHKYNHRLKACVFSDTPYQLSCFNTHVFFRSPGDCSLFSLFVPLSRTATRLCCTLCIDNKGIHSFLHSFP